MRFVPPDLQASLDSGATTLAKCWRIKTKAGNSLGFTEHDLPISFDGLIYEPESGFTSTATEAVTGLAPSTHEVSGILDSDRISETDLERGLYDGAEVSVYLVDWKKVDSRIQLSRGLIGKVRRSGKTFEAEVTGLGDRLNRPVGRAFVHSCECRLGDPKCGVDLSDPLHFGTGLVADVSDGASFVARDLSVFEAGWFSGGKLKWVSGANAGSVAHVKNHSRLDDLALLETWVSAAMEIAPGDAFEVSAGCDKTVSECIAKFDNLLNFRGFPHMPGDDQVASYPSRGGHHDGRSLFR